MGRRPLLWFSKKLDSCVESCPEQGGGEVFRVVDEELHQLVKEFLMKTVCKAKNFSNRAFPGAQPVSLARSEVDSLRYGNYLFTMKSDGLRRKFFALTLYSDRLLKKAKRDLVQEKKAHEAKLHPLLPENKSQIVTLGQMAKKYRTKAKVAKEEEDKKKQEAQAQLEKTIYENVKKVHFAGEDFMEDEEEDEEGGELEEEKGSSLSALKFDFAQAEKSELREENKRIMSMQSICGFMTRNGDIYLLPGIGVPQKFLPLVMDGELILHKPTQKYRFQIFHMDMVNGFLLNEDYSEVHRIHLYTKIARELETDKETAPFTAFIAKPKEPWPRYPLIFQEYLASREYEYEGVVANPNGPALSCGTDYSSKKIKKRGMNTIDLRSCRMPDSETQIALLKLGFVDEKTKKLVLPRRPNGEIKEYVEAKQDLVKTFSKIPGGFANHFEENRIVEFQFFPEENFYYALKNRDINDKSQPQAATVVMFTKQNAIEDITPETLMTLWESDKAAGKFDAFRKQESVKLHRFSGLDWRGYNQKGLYMQKIMNESNWTPEIIPAGADMRNSIQSLALSWQLDLDLEKEALRFAHQDMLSNHVGQIERESLPSEAESSQFIPLEKEDCAYLLSFDKLKALVKKGRKKKAENEKGTKKKKKKKPQSKKKKKSDEDEEGDEESGEEDEDEDEEPEEGVEEEEDGKDDEPEGEED